MRPIIDTTTATAALGWAALCLYAAAGADRDCPPGDECGPAFAGAGALVCALTMTAIGVPYGFSAWRGFSVRSQCMNAHAQHRASAALQAERQEIAAKREAERRCQAAAAAWTAADPDEEKTLHERMREACRPPPP